MRALGDAYPDYCINVNEVLGWGGATSVVYADGAGTVKIGIQHGWVYVPTIDSRVLDPDGTYLHCDFCGLSWHTAVSSDPSTKSMTSVLGSRASGLPATLQKSRPEPHVRRTPRGRA